MAARDQSGVLEDLEMPRYGRQAHGKWRGKFVHRGLALCEARKDRAARRVSERSERHAQPVDFYGIAFAFCS